MNANRSTVAVTTQTEVVNITMTLEEAGNFRVEVITLRDALAAAGIALELPTAEALVAAITAA